ncbi:hypothetical protein MBLNU230_g3670t1 [Neophaeotheca triangularis]
MLYRPDEVFQGDMSIVLGTGRELTVTVSNDLLVTPDRYIDTDGYVTSNNSASQVLIYPLNNAAANLPLLGRPFMSSCYLLVNYDEGTWTLWEAEPTETSELVTVRGDCDSPTTPETAAGTNSNDDAASTVEASGDAAGGNNSSMPAGTIAGAAVGGAVGALLMAAVIFVACRRWKRRKESGRDKAQRCEDHAGGSEDGPLQSDGWKDADAQELKAHGMVEVSAVRDPQEADSRPWLMELGEGRREIYELPGHHPDRSGSLMHSKLK